jgi:heme-degrading monooxygenase HmoA
MPYVLVRHKVQDYSTWKPLFDENASMRQAGGSKGGYVFRNADDPNEVLILLEWEDLGKARRFVQSEDVREKMQEAGVLDQPDIYFLDETD